MDQKEQKDEIYVKICNSIADMIQSILSANLENCTNNVQMPLSEKGEDSMALQRLRVCIGYNDDGSQIIKHVSGKTELDLADKVVKAIMSSERKYEFISEEQQLRCAEPKKMVPSFKEYAENWLKIYKVGKLRPKTLKLYRTIINCHFVAAWGNTAIDNISTEDVQKFLNDRKEHSKKSLQEMRTLLNQILNSAVADKLIDYNPAADKRIYNPSDIRNERSVLSIEEWQDIISHLDALKGADLLYMAIVAHTGMRRGEVLGLRWEDIDLTDNVIHVRRSVTHTSNEPIIGEPKTEKGKRDVPIMHGLLKFITPLKESGYIVSRAKDPDKPITFSAFAAMWRRINSSIDLHGATSHVFRHTLGTMLYDSGANIKTIQSVVGHADFGTTMNTYVHVQDNRKQEAMARVNEKLDAKRDL